MNTFDRLTAYAKEKVQATETPVSLYMRAQFRKNSIDSLITVAIASVVLSLTTTQTTSKTVVQSPAVKKFIQQELVAARTNP